VIGNCTISASVALIGTKGALGDDKRCAEFFLAVEQSKLGEIAGGPAVQLLESLKLPLILSAPARRIGWL